MADEEIHGVSRNSTRERRNRRRHSASNSEDARKAASSTEVLPVSPGKGIANHENGNVIEKDVRKKKKYKRQASEPAEMSAESRENISPTRNERRKPRKQQNVQRMPRSVSEEVLALEGKFQTQNEQEENSRPPQQTKRNRKGRRRGDTDHHHHHQYHHQTLPDDITEDQITESATNQNSDGQHQQQKQRVRGQQQQPRKKKKIRSSLITSGDEENYQGDMDGEVSEIFRIDKEDIIQHDFKQSTGKIAQISQTATLPSQPLDFLFIEKKDGQGFVREHKSKLERVNEEPNDIITLDILQKNRESTSMEFALDVHNCFQTVALIFHGLLAGITLTQCIFVYSLSETSYYNLLINYNKLAQPFQSVYYFLLAFSIVSVFDRFANMGQGWSQLFLALLTRPSRALAIIGYLFALVFSVSLAQLDDKIRLYKYTPSLWSSTSELATWRVINLIRVIGALLGWFAVALSPNDDHAAKNFKASIEQEPNESKSNIKSVASASWENQLV